MRNELSALRADLDGAPGRRQATSSDLRADLKAVNERLWVIEDDIRIKEKAQDFDDEFVRLARAVYFENDERARIKKDINLRAGLGLRRGEVLPGLPVTQPCGHRDRAAG